MAAPRKDNVKELILDTAEKLLTASALADISLAEIARTAGASPRERCTITIKIRMRSCWI